MPAPRLQSALRSMHRWIGLTLGVVLAIIGISGTLLLFQPQFFRWAHGDVIPDDLSQQIGSIEQWQSNARAALPELHGPIIMWLPHTDHNVSDAGMVIFDGVEPGGLGNLGLKAVLVAPATGAVLGVVDIDRSPAYAPIFLHGALWAGDSGKLVAGIVAAGSILMLPIGLYLWWPRNKQFAQKLSPLPWKRTFAYAARLHDWTGIWALLLLLLLAITGLYMAQPGWVEPALDLLPAQRHAEHQTAVAKTCGSATTLDEAIGKAQALLPGTKLATVLPDENDTYELHFRPAGSKSGTGETHVLVDLACGNIEIEESPDTRAPKDVVTSWLSSLHDGTVFGWPGRILVTLAGIAPLILAWSGTRLWWRRRASSKLRRATATNS